ncbi:MFS transporter [Candidatus Woesebacteria bacterium]|nr:MFS transporter [Candidatus Woesebacteria bacterium]
MKILITKLIFFQFINELNLIYPVYILLFLKYGLDAFQISLLLAIWAGSKLIFEVPTGILADKFSRRNLILIGRVLKVWALMTWLGAGSGFLFGPFWYFAIGFVLWGLSGALFSGTFLALVYDELKAYGRESEYEKVQGWMITASVSGVAIALFLGGFVAEISYAYVFLVSIASTCIAFGIMLTIKPVQKVQSTEEKNYLKFLMTAIQKARKNSYLAQVILLLVLVTGVYGTVEEFYPFVFSDLGFKEGMTGLLYSFNFVFILLGSLVVGYMTSRKGNWESLLALIGGIGFGVLGIGKESIFLSGIFVAALAITIFEIRLTNKIQSQIESHERATILSINSFLSEGFGLLLFLLFGLITKNYGSFQVITVSGMGIILISILGITMFGRGKRVAD